MDREALMSTAADVSPPHSEPEQERHEPPAVRRDPPPTSRNDRKPASKRAKAHKARGPPRPKRHFKKDAEIPLDHLLALSIPRFCKLHGISPAYYFLMRQRGEGPVEMRTGDRVLISHEAAAAWRRQCERHGRSALAETIVTQETDPDLK